MWKFLERILYWFVHEQLLHQMRPIEQAVAEGFFLIGCTQAAAEVKDSIVIV